MLFFLPQFIFAQQKVFVASKIITEKISKKKISIQGEKSSINIEGWHEDYYLLEIKLISKNVKKEQAIKDLESVKYNIDEEEDRNTYLNYFSDNKSGKRVKSNLSAIYVLKVPDNADVEITNLYGSIDIKNCNFNDASIGCDFGELQILAVQGKIEATLLYSDLTCDNMDGTINISIDKGNSRIHNCAGTVKIESNYGSFDIYAQNNNIQNLTMNSRRTEITVFATSLTDYSFDLSVQYNKIELPLQYEKFIIKNYSQETAQFNTSAQKKIKITTTYQPIIIKKLQ